MHRELIGARARKQTNSIGIFTVHMNKEITVCMNSEQIPVPCLSFDFQPMQLAPHLCLYLQKVPLHCCNIKNYAGNGR